MHRQRSIKMSALPTNTSHTECSQLVTWVGREAHDAAAAIRPSSNRRSTKQRLCLVVDPSSEIAEHCEWCELCPKGNSEGGSRLDEVAGEQEV